MRRYESNPRPENRPTEWAQNNPFAYTAARGGMANPFMKTQAHFSYSKEEELTNQALASALQGVPPEPTRELFPPRQGFIRDELDIVQVMGITRYAGRDQRFDYSGIHTRYQASSRYGIGLV